MRNDRILKRLAERLIVWTIGAVAAGIVGAAVIVGLCGCAGARPVVMEKVTHDTVRTVVHDTVWQDRFVERIVERVKREATSVRDSTVKTVDKDGNVIKEEHWRGEKTRESSEETERLRDSVAMYKARCEQMLRVTADSARVEQPSVPEKKRTGFVAAAEDCLKAVGLMAVGAAVFGLGLWWRKNRK